MPPLLHQVREVVARDELYHEELPRIFAKVICHFGEDAGRRRLSKCASRSKAFLSVGSSKNVSFSATVL